MKKARKWPDLRRDCDLLEKRRKDLMYWLSKMTWFKKGLRRNSLLCQYKNRDPDPSKMTWFKKGLRLHYLHKVLLIILLHSKMTWFKKGLRLEGLTPQTRLVGPGSKMTWFKKGLRLCCGYSNRARTGGSKMTWFKKGLRLEIPLIRLSPVPMVSRKWPDLRRDCDF